MAGGMRTIRLLLTLLAVACGTRDDSAVTDRAGKDLTEAQTQVNTQRETLTKTQEDAVKQQEALANQQKIVAEQQASLARQKAELDAAQAALAQARIAYAAATKDRLAKLDTRLAEVSAKSGAKSKDAATGLRARRDQLATKLNAMTATSDAGWNDFTKDVDTTFDSIEHDLDEAD